MKQLRIAVLVLVQSFHGREAQSPTAGMVALIGRALLQRANVEQEKKRIVWTTGMILMSVCAIEGSSSLAVNTPFAVLIPQV
jgi:hypothetical protein